AVWEFCQLTCDETTYFGGRDGMLRWEKGNGELVRSESAFIKGREAWKKKGVAIRHMRQLPATLYDGCLYDQSSAVIVPRKEEHLPAIWAFCSSPRFNDFVRELDQALKVTNATLVKVPFDLAHWEKIAAEKYPHGLPKPFSSDPTQWLFNGQPKSSDQPLQVAVARLLCYQWPRQTGSSFPDCPALGTDGLEGLADDDGIVCIPAVRNEASAPDRLRGILTSAYGEDWSPTKLDELLSAVDYAGENLENWLRDGFFEQHCRLFHNRPFIWHIWDGRRDGFSALVNYHLLDRANLEKLTYTYLGDWLTRQKAAVETGEEGSDARLQAAQELKAKLEHILKGETPFDVFIRWKPIEQQPLGWNPDLNDGVRLNIRPFIEANILKKRPNIKWGVDRGKNPLGAPWGEDRDNDTHLTLKEKHEARAKAENEKK
ncbi:MAG: type restriction endonuclease subunit, partial [Pedosphaera sp.]|nr:type restriction endonuclease subunit [Pedosphaera sp.]